MTPEQRVRIEKTNDGFDVCLGSRRHHFQSEEAAVVEREWWIEFLSSPLTWTSEQPTKPGWYWFKGRYAGVIQKAGVVLVTNGHETGSGNAEPDWRVCFYFGTVKLWQCDGDWAGPIEQIGRAHV